MTSNGSSLESGNIKFLSVARATDKSIIASYVHEPKKSGTDELAAYREMAEKVLKAPTFASQVAPNGRHSLECSPHKFHFMMDSAELVFIVITVQDYPVRLAFQLIGKMQEDLQPKLLKALTCKPNALDKDCKKEMKTIAVTYDDTTKMDKLAQVQHQVDNVRSVMHDNIKVVLGNTDKMENLEQKSDALGEQAKMFRSGGRELRRKMWMQNARMTILLAFVFLFIVLIVLAILGVFDSSDETSTDTDTRYLRSE